MRQIFGDDASALGEDALAQHARTLGIVFEHAGAQHCDRWDPGPQGMFVGKLIDPGGEAAHCRHAPVTEARANIAGQEITVGAGLARADDGDRRFGQQVDRPLHKQPMRRSL